MKAKFSLIILLLISVFVKAQSPLTDSTLLWQYINSLIKINGGNKITGEHLNISLNGILNLLKREADEDFNDDFSDTAFLRRDINLNAADLLSKADKATTITINGITYDLSANRSWTIAGGSGSTGTVTGVSVVSANGLAGTVGTNTTTPAITLSTTVTGILKGNGTAISAASAGDFPTLNQNTTGIAANITGNIPESQVTNLVSDLAGKQPSGSYLTGNQSITLSGDISGTGTTAITTTLPTVNSNVGTFSNATVTVDAKGRVTGVSGGSGGSVGTVTTVTATAPLSITGSAGPTPNVVADTSKAAGRLATYTDVNSKVDKSDSVLANRITSNTTALAGKQNAITLTTTGSGAATLTGANLNIPIPASGGGGGISGLTSKNILF